MALIVTEARDQIGVITLDNPARRNALSKALVAEITASLDDFESRKLRVAIIRARPGAGFWSAGHDVDEPPASRRDPIGWDDPLRYLIREIENFPAPSGPNDWAKSTTSCRPRSWSRSPSAWPDFAANSAQKPGETIE